ncbi:MAG: UDP-2,3-diacylglucosamine hydrolase [Rhodopirellula sp. TMED11]|nr:MAG: UDP-2,3-diacylglucosamine hydrolase [Rhodopirellula sp. TMED11]
MERTLQKVRTLFVSDVHLGCKHARTSKFLEFIQGYQPDTLYLVGDFFDAWKINYGWHWTTDCDHVIDHFVKLVESGTELFYAPGNHDAFLRQPGFQAIIPSRFPDVRIDNEFIFESLQGHRLLVTHGDLFDFFETKAQWASKASSFFYDSCLFWNQWFVRRFRGEDKNPYGICARLKQRVKSAVRFLSRFEGKLVEHAQNQGCDGVVCGHIHTPCFKRIGDAFYFNTGDWMENCTGLVERHDGRLELVSLYGETQEISLPELSADALPSSLDTSETLPGIPALPLGQSYEQVQSIA